MGNAGDDRGPCFPSVEKRDRWGSLPLLELSRKGRKSRVDLNVVESTPLNGGRERTSERP